ncbi:MAG: restriction endonuclease subunit S [Alphaproteobacteria bacterium]|nr:restriction endonuclease subunit S [Alphaproteobacteria bacterium]
MKSDLEQTEIEAPYELPEGWKWCRLGDVADWGSGGTPSRKNPEYYQGSIPWIKTGELNETYIFDSEEKVSEDAIKHSSAKIFPKETVVMAMYGATIGKTAIFGIDASTNQACACAICHKELDNHFLFNFLKSKKDYFLYNAKGGAQPNISQEIIKNTLIPLPPTLAEQQRIVNRIESMFAKLDEAKEKAQNVVDGFETRKVAILHKAFTGELTAKWRKENGVCDDSWEEKTIGECGKWERGRSKHRPRNAPELFGGKYPFIQTGDIANADIYIYEHKQTLSEFGFQQSRLFPKDTLCITIAANIGKVAILTYDCCFPDSVVGFTPFENVDSKFMYYKINDMQKDLEAMAPATAQKNLNLKLLTSVSVQIPTLPEQVEIVRILDIIIEKETRAKEAAQTVLDQIALLKKSILARAFRGEL